MKQKVTTWLATVTTYIEHKTQKYPRPALFLALQPSFAGCKGCSSSYARCTIVGVNTGFWKAICSIHAKPQMVCRLEGRFYSCPLSTDFVSGSELLRNPEIVIYSFTPWNLWEHWSIFFSTKETPLDSRPHSDTLLLQTLQSPFALKN